VAVSPTTVNDDRIVLSALEHTIEASIIMCEVVPCKIERSRHVSLFEKRGGSSIEDDCSSADDGVTEFLEFDCCCPAVIDPVSAILARDPALIAPRLFELCQQNGVGNAIRNGQLHHLTYGRSWPVPRQHKLDRMG
jgi:hypothetical protein